MGEIDTKPIESVQNAISFFGQGNHHRRNSPPINQVCFSHLIFLLFINYNAIHDYSKFYGLLTPNINCCTVIKSWM